MALTGRQGVIRVLVENLHGRGGLDEGVGEADGQAIGEVVPDCIWPMTDCAANFTSSSVLPGSYSLNAFASAGAVRGSRVSARSLMRSFRVFSSSVTLTYVF